MITNRNSCFSFFSLFICLQNYHPKAESLVTG